MRKVAGIGLFVAIGVHAFSQVPGAPALESIGPCVSPPTVRKKIEPEYSEEARKARHQGKVLMAIVVRADGKVGDVQMIRALGRGLDEQAIKAVKKWRFNPAMKEGKPVAVKITVEMNFSLFTGPKLPAALAASLANSSEQAVTVRFSVNGNGVVIPSSIEVENADSSETIDSIKDQVKQWQFKPVAGGMPFPTNLEFRINPKKLTASSGKAQ
jgi:TonB family protein